MCYCYCFCKYTNDHYIYSGENQGTYSVITFLRLGNQSPLIKESPDQTHFNDAICC